MLEKMMKSIIDQDRAAIVICDLYHTIVYMNPSAIIRYEKRGGAKLIGKSVLDCHNEHSVEMICKVLDWFKKDESNNIMFTYYNSKENKDVYMVALRDGDELIGYYEKHEYRDKEKANPYDYDNPIE